jgi:hypothetical protein
MGRYIALADHLRSRDDSVWDATFQEVEKVIGGPLPQSAYRYPAWWANQSGRGHSQTEGWKSVGWKTARVDLAGKRVRFEREERRLGAGAANDDQLVQEARRLTGINDHDLLLREALRALVAREAAARLARMGGTMPDYSAPPRQRPAR